MSAAADGRHDFSTLFEFLPIGAYRSTPDGRQLRVNPALARLNGFADEAEQLAGISDIAAHWYVNPQRRAEFMRLIERDEKVVGFESEVFRYKTRERIWVSENAHLVRDVQGQPLFYEGTVEEVTARVRDREALRDSQQQLEQIVELVPGMVYRVLLLPDGGRQASYISGGSRELFGYEPEEMLADGLLMHKLRHPEDRERLSAVMRESRESRSRVETEYRVLLPSGDVKWVRVFSAPAPSENGMDVRVGVVVDITASKQAESLRLERDRAAAANLAKSEFLSRVSHELRTPLNAVLGFAQLMELDPGHGEFSQRQLAWTRQVLASGQHLLALMNDVLDLSGAQTGRLSLNIEAVALPAALDEAMMLLTPAAQAAAITVKLAPLPAALPPVRGDRTRLIQVICNLLSNAIKYSRQGGWVRLQVHATTHASGSAVVLSVADSGPGLDEAQQARLFQPFERLGAERGAVSGTGLGLALSRQLVEAMGGSLAVDSHPGHGAIFLMRLLAAPVEPKTALPREAA
jgi:PAS domain S-box-containing protein